MPPPSPISRGHLPLSFLCSSLSAEPYLERLISDEHIEQVGGFSLLCGDLTRLDEGVVVAGNQSRKIVTLLKRPSGGETTRHGILEDDGEAACACELSNTSVSEPWPKTTLGKQMLDETIRRSIKQSWSQEAFIDALLDVLSTDTLPKGDVQTSDMRKSIFIPQVPVRGDGYGTRQQTVWLVRGRHVKLVEETIDASGRRSRIVMNHEL